MHEKPSSIFRSGLRTYVVDKFDTEIPNILKLRLVVECKWLRWRSVDDDCSFSAKFDVMLSLPIDSLFIKIFTVKYDCPSPRE